ncbi:GTPase family protein [Arhodomonas sp. AD133]|uniref:GTPase family protein n=1 Tax=Arhodomonas sp. AD133 TaxID=3415009 RepID=UPI003EB8E5F8
MKVRLPKWWRWWALVLGFAAVALPFAALVPLGALWLWQQGWLLWWLAAAAGVSLAGFGYARWLRHRAQRTREHARDDTPDEPVSAPDVDWAARELTAWEAVRALSVEVDPAIVADHRLMLAAARTTIERVARHYHPEQRYPLWRFTVPEALLLTERVSARLRVVILDHVPGSHMIHAGQLLRLWDFKPAAERGVRLFRGVTAVYRIARLANPAAALLAEARERVFSAFMGDAGTYLRRRGAQIWVEEVGRAAIELYSGRLRVDANRLDDAAAPGALGPGAAIAELPGPLRLVIAGQTKAGKSSLVNALLGEVAAGVDALPLTSGFSGYELRRDDAPEAVLIDSPGLDDEPATAAVIDCAADGDCLLWVVPAHRADRAADRAALDAVRRRFAENLQRTAPPLIVVASHIDQLTPMREWAPPYDIDEPSGAKAHAIREALEAIADDLNVPLESVVPMRLDPPSRVYNIELLWALLAQRFEAAQRGRVLRISRSLPRRDWRTVLEQAGRAGLGIVRHISR